MKFSTAILVTGVLLAPLSLPAATTNLVSVADTTLSENWPSNNLGGLKFVNAGTTQNFTKNRGLYKFDIAGGLPPHSRIISATLVLEVTKTPADGYHFADFGVHRVLQPWGEGDKTSPTNSGNVGQGGPASTNEATWFYRFAFTTNLWTEPGAAAANDYVATPSAGQTIYGTVDSPYPFGSTPRLVADVQLWLDQPEMNFGWMLVCQSEDTDFTARRFGSREDANAAPRLEITYTVLPFIDRAEKVGNEFHLFFVAQPGQIYAVEYCDALDANAWQPLAYAWTPSEPVRFEVTDDANAPRRFYRLMTY